MTHEQKLKKVTADIRAKLPRLMELGKGCLVDAECTERWEIIYCDFTEEEAIYYAMNEFLGVAELSKGDIEKIIGKEPMLNDVLEYVAMIVDEFEIVVGYSAFGKKSYLNSSICDEEWDLSKPYLKDQSEELISFLYELGK